MKYWNAHQRLADAITSLQASISGNEPQDNDVRGLLRVLSSAIKGKPILKSFGVPGDWGYETPIGSALKEALIEFKKMGSPPPEGQPTNRVEL